MKKNILITLLVIILSVSSLTATGITEKRMEAPTDSNLTIFAPANILIDHVENTSIYSIDYDKLDTNLINAVLSSTEDEYSYFIPKDEVDSFETSTSGNYVGIGILMSSVKKSDNMGYIKIMGTYIGPARKAGIRTGDLIIKVDDEDIKDQNPTEVANKIKGKENTKVKLTMRRGTKEFNITLIRQVITVPSVVSTMIKDTNIAYININSFASNTAIEFKKNLDTIMKNKVEGLILDLRSNHGGDVNATLQIAEMLLPKDDFILITEYNEKRSKSNRRYKSGLDPILPADVPIIILINSESASASEILIGALIDNNRAITVGDTTFGKGVMQEIIPFNSGYVAVTAARYKTPKNIDIDKIGISPDYKIESTVLTGEDLDIISKVSENELTQKYVSLHPKFTDENVFNFAKENQELGLSNKILYTLIRNEYLSKYDYASKYIANPKFDEHIKKALELF